MEHGAHVLTEKPMAINNQDDAVQDQRDCAKKRKGIDGKLSEPFQSGVFVD